MGTCTRRAGNFQITFDTFIPLFQLKNFIENQASAGELWYVNGMEYIMNKIITVDW